jgi:hypothetical protein
MNFEQAKRYLHIITSPLWYIVMIKRKSGVYAGSIVYNVEASDYQYGKDEQSYFRYKRSAQITLEPGTYTVELTHRSRWTGYSSIWHTGTCILSF